MRYRRIRYLDRFILYDFIRNLIILYFWIPRSPNFNAHKLKTCQWKAIRILPLVHSIHIKHSVYAKLNRYSGDGDTSTTINHCGDIREHQGNTLRTHRAHRVYRVNCKCIMYNAAIIVVWQPSGYMVLAFHWQYGDILLAFFLYLYYYFVLSVKNKYTIPYHHIKKYAICMGLPMYEMKLLNI